MWWIPVRVLLFAFKLADINFLTIWQKTWTRRNWKNCETSRKKPRERRNRRGRINSKPQLVKNFTTSPKKCEATKIPSLPLRTNFYQKSWKGPRIPWEKRLSSWSPCNSSRPRTSSLTCLRSKFTTGRVSAQPLTSKCFFFFNNFEFSGKPLLMLQSLKRAFALEPSDPRVFGCILRLQHFMQEKGGAMKAPVVEVLKKATSSIFASKSAKDANDEFIQKNSKSLEHLYIGETRPSTPNDFRLIIKTFQEEKWWLYLNRPMLKRPSSLPLS